VLGDFLVFIINPYYRRKLCKVKYFFTLTSLMFIFQRIKVENVYFISGLYKKRVESDS